MISHNHRQPNVQQSRVVFATIMLLSSVLELAVEQGRNGAEIRNMGDALWWSAGTLTTIGYGDIVPQTTAGRIIAAADHGGSHRFRWRCGRQPGVAIVRSLRGHWRSEVGRGRASRKGDDQTQ